MKLKGIVRVRSRTGYTKGWQARIEFNRVEHSKFFADKKHGGMMKARALAIEWREQKRQQLGKFEDGRRRIQTIARSNTGFVGVHDDGKGGLAVYWTPTYRGKQQRAHVRYTKTTFRTKLREAVALRERMLRGAG